MAKTILKENKESIPHLEHLAIDDFLHVIDNLGEYTLSEKVDGANLFMGIDEKGFYTYYGKSYDKKYSVDEYPIQFSTTYRRAAHAALEQVLDTIRQYVGVGDEISLEVIFGKFPNVVPYTSKSNTVVFLHATKGSPDLSALDSAIGDQSVAVKLVTPVTTDGRTINNINKMYAFSFSQVPQITLSQEQQTFVRSKIATEYSNLQAFLAQRSGISTFTNKKILMMSTRAKPDNIPSGSWASLKPEIVEKRKQLTEILKNEYLVPIKEVLLDVFVRGKYSAFGSEGDWIEGVVLSHQFRSQKIKLVDRELFLGAKDFLWDIREKLFALPFSIGNVGSFRGKLATSVCGTFGLPECGTVQATRKLKSLGSSPEQIIASLNIPDDVDSRIKLIVNRMEIKLTQFLNNYLSRVSKLSTTIKGVHFTYDGEIHNRTLQVFADMYAELNRLRNATKLNTPEAVVKEVLQPLLNRALQL